MYNSDHLISAFHMFKLQLFVLQNVQKKPKKKEKIKWKMWGKIE